MTVTALRAHRDGTGNGTGTVRWTPRRAGIQNVWRYYGEVFEFHQGRLLLRGANGSGKSKALELLLPFLFDASLRPQRLSTFGGSERTMHWNMMGEGTDNRTRVGYVWIEFSTEGSPTDDGPRRWFACGARLQATVHRTSAQADYFTLDRAVGPDEFTTPDGQPLTLAALRERLGDDGTVHDSAAEYRAEIRSTLFGGISEQRYESLILALLQLRTPKLSQRLDPSLLSTLLSRALPPLGETELGELAEGFQRLDRQREEVERLDAEAAAARSLAVAQQTYARRVVRAAAADLIAATSEMDGHTRTARENEQHLETARDELSAAETDLTGAQTRVRRSEIEIEELRARSEYREGAAAVRRIDDLRRQLAESRTRASTASATATTAAEHASADGDRAEEAAGEAGARAAETAQLTEHAADRATRAGMLTVHAEMSHPARTDRRRAESLLAAAVGGRTAQIGEVRAAVVAHERVVDRRRHAEFLVETSRSELEDALGVVTDRVAARDEAVRERGDRLTAWVGACIELRLGLADVLAAVDDEPELTVLLDRAAGAVAEELAGADADLRLRSAAVVARLREIDDERDRIRAARHVPPPAPATRTADRAASPGAPLWELVDFADDLSPGRRPGLEAALQASGLLDAWVTPGGDVTIDGHDVLADPALLTPVAAGATLADVLRPEHDGAVPADRVHALLSVVAVGDRLPADHPAAVGTDGTWRLGPTTGSWSKPEPQHIGTTARARTRQLRLAELAAERESADAERIRIEDEQSRVAGRRRTLTAERAARPDRAALDRAVTELRGAEAASVEADRTLQKNLTLLGDVSAEVTARLRELDAVAARTQMPTGTEDLDRLARAVEDFRDAAGRWLAGCAELASLTRRAADTASVAQRSAATAQLRRDEAVEAAEHTESLEHAVHTAESTIDQAYQEIADRLDVLQQALGAVRAQATEAGERRHEIGIRIARLETQLAAAVASRDEATVGRDAAGERMRLTTAEPFGPDAGLNDVVPSGEGVRATLETARAVAARWASTPHEPRQIAQALSRLHDELHRAKEVLAPRADLELDPVANHHVLTANAGGVRTGASGLAEAVAAEAERAREDITEAERTLFETTLTGDTRRHLADRIRRASALVDSMNDRLDEVRTASRVAVRLEWELDPDLPASAKAARELLLRDPSRLGEEDREALHRFFRDRVDEARARDDAVSWEQQLGEVFDYTAWHRFVVRVDRGKGDGWQPLTKKLHGALSGGEKAIALHLPLFAAVAAHYESVPGAPRLILLDEVFVGVDEVNRGQVFSLLASLDLDLLLTSDHEWCAYSELDGIAVHQLVTGDGDDAVTTARFVWDGEDWMEGGDDDGPD